MTDTELKECLKGFEGYLKGLTKKEIKKGLKRAKRNAKQLKKDGIELCTEGGR